MSAPRTPLTSQVAPRFCASKGPGDQGFTLVELLLIVALIALLIAILLPALSGARNKARDSVCLSNLRQLLTAWAAYENEYRGFPVGEDPLYVGYVRFGWGGVHWYDDTPVPTLGILPDRPLNVMITGETRVRARMDVFRCPSDNGAALAASGERPWAQWGANSPSQEGDQTLFGLAGASYTANGWMYCEPGARSGWGLPTTAGGLPPLYRTRLSSQSCPGLSSRFIVLGDSGSVIAGLYSKPDRLARNMFVGWWHGSEYSNTGYLDGSARRTRMGDAERSDYSIFLNPAKHRPSSWKTPWTP